MFETSKQEHNRREFIRSSSIFGLAAATIGPMVLTSCRESNPGTAIAKLSSPERQEIARQILSEIHRELKGVPSNVTPTDVVASKLKAAFQIPAEFINLSIDVTPNPIGVGFVAIILDASNPKVGPKLGRIQIDARGMKVLDWDEFDVMQKVSSIELQLQKRFKDFIGENAENLLKWNALSEVMQNEIAAGLARSVYFPGTPKLEITNGKLLIEPEFSGKPVAIADQIDALDGDGKLLFTIKPINVRAVDDGIALEGWTGEVFLSPKQLLKQVREIEQREAIHL